MNTAFHPEPVDLQEALTSYRTARAVLSGHLIVRIVLRAHPAVVILEALDTIPALCGEILQLRTMLVVARLDHANLIAAARATLAAHHEGEPDSLWYLRDELTARGLLAANPWRRA